ncbi:EscU/YscU/HrcU family type III secretion system export apparatus switch protein [Salirhabdus salicampi]|uniref:EscU/YscU/HrcU family type III secretion system export apparatus switch protein n=1 Tax=Salirhabdus salicampi TaxID=476102 RepID=UPI0020C4FA1F|nr:EscU/YscU/HrcU family type III secretion system export apparatus switch protein [Salirhabdus salicampi]MCP8616537.1 EscU/YscU/HrcU family type III secretion system export apparatus switch protein [Salirhabdus salicampi]
MKDQKREQKSAFALRYEEKKDDSPRVIAKGEGYVAENMIEKANDHNIPVYEDETLTELLGELSINEKIPEELYEVVAEVFAFIYKVDKKQKA